MRRRGGAPSMSGDIPAPRAGQKMSHKWRALGARLQGANLARLRARGNPCRHAPRLKAPADKNGSEATTAVPSVARAPQGRARWRGGATRRRSPTRATTRSGEKHGLPRKRQRPGETGDHAKGCGAAEHMKKKPHNNEASPSHGQRGSPAPTQQPRRRAGAARRREKVRALSGDGWP